MPRASLVLLTALFGLLFVVPVCGGLLWAVDAVTRSLEKPEIVQTRRGKKSRRPTPPPPNGRSE